MSVVSGFFLCSATTEKVKHMKKQIFGQSFRHQPLSSHVWQTSGQTSSSCQTSYTGGLGTGEASSIRGERTKGAPFSVLSLCMWSVCKLCGNFQLDKSGQEQLMPRMLKHSLKSGLFAQSFHSWMAARFLGANYQALGETPGNLNKAHGNCLWPWWQYISHLILAHHLLWAGWDLWPGLYKLTWPVLASKETLLTDPTVPDKGNTSRLTGALGKALELCSAPSPFYTHIPNLPEERTAVCSPKQACCLGRIQLKLTPAFVLAEYISCQENKRYLGAHWLHLLKCATACSGLSPFCNVPQVWGREQILPADEDVGTAPCKPWVSGYSSIVGEATPLTTSGSHDCTAEQNLEKLGKDRAIKSDTQRYILFPCSLSLHCSYVLQVGKIFLRCLNPLINSIFKVFSPLFFSGEKK